MKKGSDKYRVLAVAIIKSAVHDKDWAFFHTDWFHTLATLAYGGKVDYMTPDELIKLAMDNEDINSHCSNGQKSKWNY